MYIIVNRIELINNEVKFTPVGYITSENDANTINTNYENSLGIWLKNNVTELTNGTKSISEYFALNPIVYSAYQETTNISGMGLSLINNINNIE
jgi:hypothetical protein